MIFGRQKTDGVPKKSKIFWGRDDRTASSVKRGASSARRTTLNAQRNSVFCLLIICLLLLFPSISNSNDMVEVRGVRHWSDFDYIRIVVDLSGNAEFTRGRLSDPERLFFDLKNTRIRKGIETNITIGGKVLKAIRIGQFAPDTVRIVFDLETTLYDFRVFSLEDPSRLVIDIISRQPKTPDELKQELKTESNIVPKLLRRTVVIDPGHGGHDPGAVGPGGLFEKDVVLDISLMIREIMQKEYPFYEVILTRDRDIFIPLDRRAVIANRINADIFVSVHTNASYNRLARGIETYLLNWTDDEEAMKVAARENNMSLERMRQVQSELGFILASLARESKRDESIKLAGYIQRSLISAVQSRHPEVADRGVRQALFYVLLDAEMPSALLEVGFISNREEERLLENRAHREKLARSIASGIHSYLTSAPEHRVAAGDKKDSEDYSPRRVKYTAPR